MGQTVFPVPTYGLTYTVVSVTATGTVTIPATSTGYIDVFIQAGGGGGGRPTLGNANGGGAGGPGWWVFYQQTPCAAGTVLTVTVGGGGNGGTADGTVGSNGSDSTITGSPALFATIGANGGLGGLVSSGASGTALSSTATYHSGFVTPQSNTNYAVMLNGPSMWGYCQPNQAAKNGISPSRGTSGSQTLGNNIVFDGAATVTTSVNYGVALPLLTSTLRNATAGSSGTNGPTSNGGSSTANTRWAGQGGNGGVTTSPGGTGNGGGGGGGGGANASGTAGAGGNASANSGAGGGGGGGANTGAVTGNGGNGGSGFVVIGYWS